MESHLQTVKQIHFRTVKTGQNLLRIASLVLLTNIAGSPGSSEHWGPAEALRLGGKGDDCRVDEAHVEGRDGPGCCSTGLSCIRLGTSSIDAFSSSSLSGSGEVEEERGVVEEVVDDEEWGEVSEEEASG